MKFNDVDGNGTSRIRADTRIAGWPINLYTLPGRTTAVQTVNTDASGTYSVHDPRGRRNYRVCEGQKARRLHRDLPQPAGTVLGGETIVNTCPAPQHLGL